MKVYLVTTGEYSDYSIHSVWDNEETADKVCTFFGPYDYANVEEFEVNESSKAENPYWKFQFEDDGTVANGWGNGEAELEGKEIVERWKCNGGNKWITKVIVQAKDKDHAFKKAQDVRTQFLANQAGI